MSGSEPLPARLGRYEILRRLGAGGMAEVFLAKSAGAEGVEKVLVVKRVLPTFSKSEKFGDMFRTEAEVATHLNHPNVVQVYGFERTAEGLLLPMEFVDGLDLGRLVSAAKRQRERIPQEIAAFVVLEVGKGLEYAHNRRDTRGQPLEIVHRDVSPQNVLLSYEGTVKIADFGIAKARLVSEETGVIKGKFSYMSPEQARGERVDRRSDVYSLGVLLGELTMGRAMYPGQHGLDVLELVRKGRVTLPREVDPAVAPELHEIVRVATRLHRDERYASARQLTRELAAYLHAQRHVVDGASLEEFIARVSPRELTSPEASAGMRSVAGTTAATVASAAVGREHRERRQVVIVSGVVRPSGSPAASDRPPRSDSAGTADVPPGAVGGVASRFGGSDLERAVREDREAEPVQVDALRRATTTPRLGPDSVRVLGEIAYKANAVLEWTDEGARFRYVLGLRGASTHDALHAVRLALDVLDALQGGSEDRPLTASLGLSRGFMATVRNGAGKLIRTEPQGALFEVADRLAEAGAASAVLAAGEVYRLARRSFTFEAGSGGGRDDGPRGDAPLGMRAYRLATARLTDAVEIEPASVLGREEELRAIDAAYRRVVATRTGAFFGVVGELGVGKSAVLRAAVERFGGDARLLQLECPFGSEDAPYSILYELLRVELAPGGSEDVRHKLDEVLDRIIDSPSERDAIRAALEPLLAPRRSQDPEIGHEEQWRSVARAVRQFLSALAAHRPVVVWLDSLQWSDAPSLEVLGGLTALSIDAPIFFVLGSRPDPRVERLLARVPRITLGEVPPEARADLVRARFEGAEVPPDVLGYVLDKAGGNPFFIVEIVEALLERRVVRIEDAGADRRVVRASDGQLALPSTLEGVIAARLGELPEAERSAALWLSLAGGMRADELARLAGTALDGALDGLASRGLVEQRPGAIFALTSTLIRQVAYESIDPADRARMHRRAASFLLAAGRVVAPAKLARHLELGGDAAGAAARYLDAAAAARAAYSNRDALRLYARAIALLPADSAERFAAHEAREQILRGLGGRQPEQCAEVEAMRAIAEARREPSLVALVNNRLARLRIDGCEVAGDARRHLAAALYAAEKAGSRGAIVEALRLGAELSTVEGDAERALAAFDRALATAGLDRDLLAARGSVLVHKALVLMRQSRLEEALSPAVEAVVLFRRLRIKRNEAQACNVLGVVLALRGEFEDALALIRTSITLDREIGDRFKLGTKLSNLGQLYGDLGDFERGLEFCGRGLVAFRTLGHLPSHCDTLSAIAEMHILSDRSLDEAEAALDQADALADRTGDAEDRVRERYVRALHAQRRGEPRRAEELASVAVELASERQLAALELQARVLRLGLAVRRGETEGAADEAAAILRRATEEAPLARLHRIALDLSDAFGVLGLKNDANRALGLASNTVDTVLARLREPDLRRAYLTSPAVRRIREFHA